MAQNLASDPSRLSLPRRFALALALAALSGACGDPDRDDDLDSGMDPGTATGGTNGGATGAANATGGTGSGSPTSGGTGTATGGVSNGGVSNGGTGTAGSSGGSGASTTGAATGGATSGTSSGGSSGGTTAGSDDPHQKCVDRINEYRATLQLAPLARWVEGEACTDQQSADDNVTDKAHGNVGKCDESAQNTCPNWRSVDQVLSGCLQLMWDEGPPPDPDNCTGDCFQMHGHFINMSSTRFTKVACGFNTGADGKVWSNQNFSR
jgi:hypothetical protein